MTAPLSTGSKVETGETVQIPLDKPPALLNSLMRWMLITPGIQRMVGQGVALLTFTGRRSGKTYTIPVSYHREDDTVTVITKRQRNWWHNLDPVAEVELRLAGRDYTGKAEVTPGGAEALEFMTDYLERRPVDAKAYGLSREAGKIPRDKVAELLPHLVLIRISITPAG